METITLKDDHREFTLPVVTGTENEKGIDISKLRSETGYITLDPVLPTLMERKAFFAIGVYPSKNWLLTVILSK